MRGKTFFSDGHRFTAGRHAFSLGTAKNLHRVDRLHGLPGAPVQGRSGGQESGVSLARLLMS